MADPWSDSSSLVIARIVQPTVVVVGAVNVAVWLVHYDNWQCTNMMKESRERERGSGRAEEHEWNRDIQKVGNKRENN